MVNIKTDYNREIERKSNDIVRNDLQRLWKYGKIWG